MSYSDLYVLHVSIVLGAFHGVALLPTNSQGRHNAMVSRGTSD